MARTRAPHRGGADPRPRGPGGRSPSPPRRLAIALIAAVTVVGVFALGRASVEGGSAPSAPSPLSGIPGVGPTRTVHGVPAGYAHTRAGALAAALNYIGVVGNPAVLVDVGRVQRALSVLATPQLARRVLAGYRQAADRLAQSPLVRSLRSGAPAIAMGVPVAYRVLRSSRDRLLAEFWMVGVAGDVQGISPYAVWRRNTATFGWVGNDWKLVAPLEHQDGPVPALEPDGRVTGATSFIDELRGFRGFRYVP